MILKNRKLARLLVFISVLVLLISMSAFKNEPDALHKREFNISLCEVKNGIAAKKTIPDVLYFKDGKLFSDFLNEKFGYRYLKYRINKDSVFTDFTDTEVRLLEVEAVQTNESNQSIFVSFSTSEWDIDGQIRITKNDKLKKHFDFTGREKGGKPKKKKRKEQSSGESEVNP